MLLNSIHHINKTGTGIVPVPALIKSIFPDFTLLNSCTTKIGIVTDYKKITGPHQKVYGDYFCDYMKLYGSSLMYKRREFGFIKGLKCNFFATLPYTKKTATRVSR